MIQQMALRFRILACLAIFLFSGHGLVVAGQGGTAPQTYLTQMPFEPPPQPEYTPGEDATPAPEMLNAQEQDRLESLLPLLDGKQELWAMGEFVHFGKHSVPHLVKALKMPGPRVRFNAVETLSMIKDPSAAPALVDLALEPNGGIENSIACAASSNSSRSESSDSCYCRHGQRPQFYHSQYGSV